MASFTRWKQTLHIPLKQVGCLLCVLRELEKVCVWQKIGRCLSRLIGQVVSALKPFNSYLICRPTLCAYPHLEFLTASWEQTVVPQLHPLISASRLIRHHTVSCFSPHPLLFFDCLLNSTFSYFRFGTVNSAPLHWDFCWRNGTMGISPDIQNIQSSKTINSINTDEKCSTFSVHVKTCPQVAVLL